ncbi:MAG: hypothetical protein QOF76_4042 [Solirubrobacteraceae bacterium]|nr:hypothetical protein [Solirubrobacteraceae bacterium]
MLTRRDALQRSVAGLAALALPQTAGARGAVPLPSARVMRRDIQRMVDLGPRYTGTAGHGAFIDWLEEELIEAGVVMLPRDHEKLTIWEASAFGLELDGTAVRTATYYPRSQETGPGGVTGPLVYAGALPLPQLNLGPESGSAAADYGATLASWAQGLGGAGSAQGAVLLVDVPMPLPLTAGIFVPLATELVWPGHSTADFAAGDYKRPWIAPGVTGIPTAAFGGLGAVGCVFILDAPYEAIRDGYMPFENGFEELPALFVDRDTGAELRAAAAGRPTAKLTLEATRRDGTSPALLGYLPGTSRADEALFLNSHTDGEGFVEENGGVGMVHLARHFGSLRGRRRLTRTLVFSLWPGHMASGMPQLQGVLDEHADIVRSAAAGITIEHLGCTEWIDTADKGYHATGEAETLGCWTTQGKVFEITRDATVAAALPRVALLRPPVQFGVGGALQSAGVPQVGFLAGPYYLLSNAPGGDMEKLDAGLAARQVAWVADLLRRMDAVPAADLAAGDPSLGSKSEGPRATYPPAPPFALRVALTRLGGNHVRGRVRVNRLGPVRLQAFLIHGRLRVPLGRAVVRPSRTGTTAFSIKVGGRGKRALKNTTGGRVVLVAQARDRGRRVVRRALRRRA